MAGLGPGWAGSLANIPLPGPSGGRGRTGSPWNKAPLHSAGDASAPDRCAQGATL